MLINNIIALAVEHGWMIYDVDDTNHIITPHLISICLSTWYNICSSIKPPTYIWLPEDYQIGREQKILDTFECHCNYNSTMWYDLHREDIEDISNDFWKKLKYNKEIILKFYDPKCVAELKNPLDNRWNWLVPDSRSGGPYGHKESDIHLGFLSREFPLFKTDTLMFSF